jgi:hypothetical protein
VNYWYYIIYQRDAAFTSNTDGIAMYLDMMGLCPSADRYRSFSLTPMPCLLDSGTRTDDVVAFATSAMAAPWTVMIDWYPLEGCENYFGNIPVLTLTDAGGSIMAWWDYSNRKFYLYDSDTASSASATAQRWRHWDCVKVAITNNGTYYQLCTWNPLDGFVADAMDTAMLQVNPTSIVLGNYSTDTGGGRYANLRLWDTELSSTEVMDWFKMTTTGPGRRQTFAL